MNNQLVYTLYTEEKMKKLIVLISIGLVLLLAGCSTAQTEQSQDLPSEESADTSLGVEPESSASDESNPVSDMTQLLVGTLLLEGTELEVTPEQAADLLPLWKLYRSLLESDITATAEIEAVAKQISQKMSADQLASLATFESQEIDREQINAIMEELGISTMSGMGDPEGDGGEGITPPDGAQLGQGRGQGGGTGVDPDVLATRQAERGDSGLGSQRMILPLVEALIELLEQRVV